MPSAFGLIDGNAFWSCERAFSPKLRRHAVVVLSNNDGFCNRGSVVNPGLASLRPIHHQNTSQPSVAATNK